MEALLAPLVIGTGAFFAIRFHAQGKGWGWGLLYGLFLMPVALAHALIIAFTAFFNGGGFPRSAQSETALYDSGFRHMMSGEYDKAIDDFDGAIELEPRIPHFYEIRGRTYALQSRYDKAISDFNSAIDIVINPQQQDIDPHGCNPYHHRGVVWTQLNEYGRAIEDFTNAIALEPSPETYLARGQTYTELGNHDKALEDYEEAISLSPNADAYQNRGIAYLNLGEQDKALNDFHIAIRLGQEVPAAHLGAAKAHFDKKDFKKAIAEFTQGISLLPDYMEANSGLFEMLKQEEQLEVYDIAIDVMTELYRGRGVCHLNLGEYQEAIEDFDAAIGLNSNDSNAYRGRGASYSQIKKHTQAVEDLDIVASLDPDSANTFFTRGIVHFNKEDYDSGLRDFSNAIKIEATHANSYIGRGTCYLYLGRHLEALNDLDKAINLVSINDVTPETDLLGITIDHSYAYANRGLTYSMLNRESAAKKDFDKAVSLGFDYSQIEEDLQELKGQSKRAEGNFKINPSLNVRHDDVSIHTNYPIAPEKVALGKFVVASENEMTSELEHTVLDILTNNLRPGSSEAEDPNKQHLPRQAVSNATPESLRAFIEIHEAISAIVGPDHYRTRHAGRTSKERIGLVYVTHPIVAGKRARVQIQTLQLPLRPSWSGYIHAGLSGHAQVPIQAKYIENIDTRAGKPVFLVTDRPTPQLCEGLISAFRASSLFNDIQY